MATDVEVVAIILAIASLVVAILVYLLNRNQVRESREQTAVYAKRLELAEKQLELNQANLKLVEKGVGAMLAIAESQKKQVQALLERAGAGALEKAVDALQKRLSENELPALRATKDAIVKEREIALKEQRALLEKQRANWSILASVAKALGWAYDRGLIGGGDEDDEEEG